MLPTLEKNERFQTEYNSFRTRIANIQNEKAKTELTGMLTNLLREVRMLDEQHLDIFTAKQIPSLVPEIRSRIQEIRQSLDRRLKDWEQSRQA